MQAEVESIAVNRKRRNRTKEPDNKSLMYINQGEQYNQHRIEKNTEQT